MSLKTLNNTIGKIIINGFLLIIFLCMIICGTQIIIKRTNECASTEYPQIILITMTTLGIFLILLINIDLAKLILWSFDY